MYVSVQDVLQVKHVKWRNYFDDACPTTTGQIYEGSSFIQLNTISKCMDEEFKKMWNCWLLSIKLLFRWQVSCGITQQTACKKIFVCVAGLSSCHLTIRYFSINTTLFFNSSLLHAMHLSFLELPVYSHLQYMKCGDWWKAGNWTRLALFTETLADHATC